MRQIYYYNEIEDMYEDMLDDCNEVVNIGGMRYNPGRVLREVDPIAFDCGVSEYMDESFIEVTAKDLEPEEVAHYMLSDEQVVYLQVEEG